MNGKFILSLIENAIKNNHILKIEENDGLVSVMAIDKETAKQHFLYQFDKAYMDYDLSVNGAVFRNG